MSEILLYFDEENAAHILPKYSTTIYFKTKESQEEFEKRLKEKQWIPVEERLPEDDNFILLSFENFSVPMIGRYEEDEDGGSFYAGDEELTLCSYGLFVNAWMPLPEPYKEEE